MILFFTKILFMGFYFPCLILNIINDVGSECDFNAMNPRRELGLNTSVQNKNDFNSVLLEKYELLDPIDGKKISKVEKNIENNVRDSVDEKILNLKTFLKLEVKNIVSFINKIQNRNFGHGSNILDHIEDALKAFKKENIKIDFKLDTFFYSLRIIESSLEKLYKNFDFKPKDGNCSLNTFVVFFEIEVLSKDISDIIRDIRSLCGSEPISANSTPIIYRLK